METVTVMKGVLFRRGKLCFWEGWGCGLGNKRAIFKACLLFRSGGQCSCRGGKKEGGYGPAPLQERWGLWFRTSAGGLKINV